MMPTLRPERPFPRLLRATACLSLLLMLFPILAHAQSGKIAGQVTERGTGEQLIGVNVMLDGTRQGTVTNSNGEFVLIGVRPGTYTVVFSYIGFQTQRVEGIQVATGQTTRLDVELGEEVIQGEEIVVQAERPLVQKDLTASKKTVGAEEIDALPVESFLGVLTTQAGVNTGPGGEIHIRGGRSNEIAYLVDGLSVGNPFNTNGLATSVATDAIQEMTVISGAFNAEYGKAMSGIVNLVTKEGTPNFGGSFSFYGGDTATRHGDIFFTPESVNLNTYTLEGTLSGPLPILDRSSFFLSFRQDVDNGYIYGKQQHLPSDSANFNVDPNRLAQIQQYIPGFDDPNAWYYELHGKPWYAYAEGEEIPGELVSMNNSQSTNFIGKLTLRPLSGAKVEYSFLLDKGQRCPFNFAYRFNPDGTSEVRDQSLNHSIHWTHAISDRTFYTIRASLQDYTYSDYLYENPTDPRYVSSRRILGFPGNNFLLGGNEKGYVTEEAQSFRTKLDITRQFGVIHEAKAGLDLQLHRLSRDNFTILFDGNLYRQPTVLPADESPAHDTYVNQPVSEFSAYLQDKLEFDDFIINAGLRYEFFDPHSQYIPNLLEPKQSRAETDRTHLLLPRLGVSFPITEQGIIHFSYGHFAQMPSLRSMYINPEFEFPVNAVPTFGNANIRPERTVQYELGLQQQLTSDLAFDVTGFFKDIRDYLALQTLRYSTIAGEDRYGIYLNLDYANVKGLTFALTKRRARNGLVAATVDYTFQVAEGNNTDTDAFFFNVLSGRETELELVPLDFDQRHILSSTVTLTRPGSWGLSMIGQFGTGYPYTPLLIEQKIDQLPKQGRKPATHNVNLHVYKDFQIGRAQMRLFGKMFNVLDHLSERFVFDDTGRATYSLNGRRGTHASWESYYGQLGVNDLATYNTRPQYYSRPREVRLGITLSF